MTGLNKKQHLAQRVQEAEQKIQKKEEKLIVPNKSSQLMRLATIPDFSSLVVEKNNQFAFSFVYDNPITKTKVRAETSKQFLKEHNLTDKDMAYRDTRFELSVANWLMDKKARYGDNKVEGSIKELTKSILGDKQRPRKEDYKKTEVNLKSLAVRQYIVKKGGTSITFMLVNPLKFTRSTGRFVCYISDLVPQVVKDTLAEPSKEPLAQYTNLSSGEYYPKQKRYTYNLKQYLVGIKNTKKDIPSIKGITILDHSGYLADVRLKRKKYRTKEAQKIINRFVALGKEYGLRIGCHKKSDKVKDVRQRYYYIKAPYHKQEKESVPDEIKKALIDEVAVIINREPQYSNMDICKYRAKGLLTKYGFRQLKEMSDKGQREHKDAFNISLLEQMLVKKTGY